MSVHSRGLEGTGGGSTISTMIAILKHAIASSAGQEQCRATLLLGGKGGDGDGGVVKRSTSMVGRELGSFVLVFSLV